MGFTTSHHGKTIRSFQFILSMRNNVSEAYKQNKLGLDRFAGGATVVKSISRWRHRSETSRFCDFVTLLPFPDLTNRSQLEERNCHAINAKFVKSKMAAVVLLNFEKCLRIFNM